MGAVDCAHERTASPLLRLKDWFWRAAPENYIWEHFEWNCFFRCQGCGRLLSHDDLEGQQGGCECRTTYRSAYRLTLFEAIRFLPGKIALSASTRLSRCFRGSPPAL